MGAALIIVAVVLGFALPRVTASVRRALRITDPTVLAAILTDVSPTAARPSVAASPVASPAVLHPTESPSTGDEELEQVLTAALLSGAISAQQYRRALEAMLSDSPAAPAPLRPAR